MAFWEALENEVFRNEHLDIYEKMCLMVLMSQGEEANLTSEKLASYMGCGVNTAKRAFESLRIKGYLTKDYQNSASLTSRESNVIRTSDAVDISKPVEEITESFQEGFFTRSEMQNTDNQEDVSETERRKQMAAYLLGDTLETSKTFVSKKISSTSLVDQVIEMVDEKISYKEANIILAFAANDLDKIKKKYAIAKQSQMTDTISVLINELQKKETETSKTGETMPENSQIDANRLLKMQAYQNSRYKK
jgi:DNA-binding transcriptional regulator YhcF (GntR family)